MSRFVLAALLPLLALAACGPDTPAETAEEALDPTVPDSVAGSYALYAVDDEPLPGGVGFREGCEVQLSEGRLDLSDDAVYALDLLARTVCEDEDDERNRIDRTTSEGPFVVDGSEIRFSPEIALSGAETDEAELEEEDEAPDLFNVEAFAGTGVLTDTLLTVQLTDDLTTLTFVRD